MQFGLWLCIEVADGRAYPKQPLSSHHLHMQRQKTGGILTKPGLKIHNLGCVYFVELALIAFSHLVDHKVLSRASIYICNFTFLKFFNLAFSLNESHVDFVVQASRKRGQQPALHYMVTTKIKEHQIFHQELFGSLLQQTR